MNFEQKIVEIRNIIYQKLTPYIDSDYVLWEVPYYTNIGDVLIWEGELDFLRNSGYSCLGMASKDTCMFPKLAPETIIFLQGGGNFGDLWRDIHEFRLKVIEKYPENRIIIFPQSVFYENTSLIKEDASKMALHKKLIICARDNYSYKLLKGNFTNDILLVPDMAFCIDCNYLSKWNLSTSNGGVYVRRLDKEMGKELDKEKIVTDNLDIRDWPSLERPLLAVRVYNKIISLQRKMLKYKVFYKLLAPLVDFIAFYRLRPLMIKQGVQFISSYRMVYTTRLHVMILSVLMHKEVLFIDNSYGKNSSFYNSWLKDLESVKPYK